MAPPSSSKLYPHVASEKSTRVVRITDVPYTATPFDLLRHFASASPISVSQGKDEVLGGFSIAYMYFGTRGDRERAQGLHESWLIGRELNVEVVTEGFSFEGDQIVALRGSDRSRMAKSSAMRTKSTEVEQADTELDESGTAEATECEDSSHRVDDTPQSLLEAHTDHHSDEPMELDPSVQDPRNEFR